MSCSFFIKINLKKKYKVNELFDVIIEEIKDTKWKYKLKKDENLEIIFNDKSEPLVFRFYNHRMNEICKIDFKSNEEAEIFLRFLYNIKKMFSFYDISDDFGLWNDFIAKKNPCKITLRELSEKEKKEIELFDYKKYRALDVFFGIMAKDLKTEKEYNNTSFQELIKNINPFVKQQFFWIDSDNPVLVFADWVYEIMEYKNFGKVKSVDMTATRGLGENYSALIFGIMQVIFGTWGGNINSKQSQIVKLYEQTYRNNLDIENDVFVLYRFILSALEYTGFKKNI